MTEIRLGVIEARYADVEDTFDGSSGFYCCLYQEPYPDTGRSG